MLLPAMSFSAACQDIINGEGQTRITACCRAYAACRIRRARDIVAENVVEMNVKPTTSLFHHPPRGRWAKTDAITILGGENGVNDDQSIEK